ncbi:DUF4396 domain-containing protein [Halobellus rubicundus]|uniref:DUF4396 domain-containing protein n=1 Tax=Halobellus rubicundus TaxID=2996466 RepID=A0ABD5MAB8_9EURY
MLAAPLAGLADALAPFRAAVVPALSDPTVLAAWAVLVALALGALLWDLRTRNAAIPSLMKGVWTLVVLYAGPFGLAVYWRSGRSEMARDSLWRRGARSTAHCFSGCGAGEVTGVVVLVGLLTIESTLATTLGTFALAYLFGYALTVGPLLQDGESLGTAVRDALYTETPSITVMEVVAIGTDVLLAGEATIGTALFWGALIFSLSLGFAAAYPINVALIAVGIKEGMGDPTAMDGASAI